MTTSYCFQSPPVVPVPIIQTPRLITSIPEDKPISPVSPTMLPTKDNLLSEPTNKKYRATPERIGKSKKTLYQICWKIGWEVPTFDCLLIMSNCKRGF